MQFHFTYCSIFRCSFYSYQSNDAGLHQDGGKSPTYTRAFFCGKISRSCKVIYVSYHKQPMEVILRCYGVLFGVIIVLVEAESLQLLDHMAILESWIARGLCYGFVGLLDLLFEHRDKENTPRPDGSSHSPTPPEVPSSLPYLIIFWRNITGILVITSGALYFIFGSCCFRRLKGFTILKMKRQKVMKQEMSYLNAQKMEIERLLSDTESKLQSL